MRTLLPYSHSSFQVYTVVSSIMATIVYIKNFPGGSDVKRLPTVWETRVQSLGPEDPVGKEMATHSSTLAWKIPWMEERGGPQSLGSQRVGQDWATSLWCTLDFPGGANGNEPTCRCRRHETQLWSLGQEDLLEEGMATHSRILTSGSPWTQETGGLQSVSQRVRLDWSDWAHRVH